MVTIKEPDTFCGRPAISVKPEESERVLFVIYAAPTIIFWFASYRAVISQPEQRAIYFDT